MKDDDATSEINSITSFPAQDTEDYAQYDETGHCGAPNKVWTASVESPSMNFDDINLQDTNEEEDMISKIIQQHRRTRPVSMMIASRSYIGKNILGGGMLEAL